MIETSSSIYSEKPTPKTYLTIDGRVGAVVEFKNKKELVRAFTLLRKQHPYLHIQALDYFGSACLTVSRYAEVPKVNPLLPISAKQAIGKAQNFEYEGQYLQSLLSQFSCRYLTEYPELLERDISNLHIYKLKYAISWPESVDQVPFIAGFGLLHLPFDDYVRVMYATEKTLQEMLSRNILCVEFVEEFRLQALQFWKPLGCFQLIAEKFRL